MLEVENGPPFRPMITTPSLGTMCSARQKLPAVAAKHLWGKMPPENVGVLFW
jgi:hypothetical protein